MADTSSSPEVYLQYNKFPQPIKTYLLQSMLVSKKPILMSHTTALDENLNLAILAADKTTWIEGTLIFAQENTFLMTDDLLFSEIIGFIRHVFPHTVGKPYVKVKNRSDDVVDRLSLHGRLRFIRHLLIQDRKSDNDAYAALGYAEPLAQRRKKIGGCVFSTPWLQLIFTRLVFLGLELETLTLSIDAQDMEVLEKLAVIKFRLDRQRNGRSKHEQQPLVLLEIGTIIVRGMDPAPPPTEVTGPSRLLTVAEVFLELLVHMNVGVKEVIFSGEFTKRIVKEDGTLMTDEEMAHRDANTGVMQKAGPDVGTRLGQKARRS